MSPQRSPLSAAARLLAALRLAPLRLVAAAALLAIAAIATLPARADDGRYQDFPVGSRATALGGAFTALSDDPSGLYYNPAGVCDARRFNVSVSASLYGVEKHSQGAIKLDTATFSLATLNVIPGEAGFLKGYGPLDARGTPFAIGFDVTVPSFRSYGTDATEPFGGLTRQLHSRVLDRTFVVAAGGAMRFQEKWSFGLAFHYVLHLFEQTEDALVYGSSPSDPPVGVYHAAASFQNGNLVALLGAKYRHDDRWLFGASVGLPSIGLNSAGRVNVQDVFADPSQPEGSRTTVSTVNESDRIRSRTPVPLQIRLGVARVEPQRWTLSGQVTFHAGTSYDRFDMPQALADRLRVQDHVERSPVLDLNAGGEYLLSPEWTIAAGLFTDHSGAQGLDAQANGILRAGSSRLPNLNAYGGTLTMGMIGNHSISRLGMSIAYGSGEEAVADETGGIASTTYQRTVVHQLFLYFFLASTFRY